MSLEKNIESGRNKFFMAETCIKHIVCSGGGTTGFIFYGLIKESNKQGLWNIENIDSLYGTSIGALIMMTLLLRYDWDVIDDFLIKRPWESVYQVNMYSFLAIFSKKGIFSKTVIRDTVSPLLHGRGLSLDITMEEFFAYSGIELHIFTTEINSFAAIDVCHKTHPEWKLVDALYASCALPVLFPPFTIDAGEHTGCYFDGGILADFPYDACIRSGALQEEIFSINRYSPVNIVLNIESSFFNMIETIVYKYINLYSKSVEPKGTYYFIVENCGLSLQMILDVMSNRDERIRLIQEGEQIWRDFKKNHV